MKNKNIIKIIHRQKILAIIVKAEFKKEGIEFFTPNQYSQQLAFMHRPRGYVINSHLHKPIMEEIKLIKETLFIRKGKVRIDFYNERKCYIESRIVDTGDVVFLAFGGHGLEFLEDTEIIEVKQGPYTKDKQAVKFNPVKRDKLKIKK